jgi:hypothetical protein
VSTLGQDLSRQSVAERTLETVRMSRNGLKVREIALKLGVSERTVERYRKAAGICHPYHQLSNEEVMGIKAMIDDGFSYSEISRTTGVDWQAIKRRFPDKGYTKSQAAEARNLRRQLDAIEDQSNRREFNEYRPK